MFDFVHVFVLSFSFSGTIDTLTLLRMIESFAMIVFIGGYFFLRWIIDERTPLLLREPFTKKKEMKMYFVVFLLFCLTGFLQLYVRAEFLTNGSMINDELWSMMGLLAFTTIIGMVAWIRPLIIGMFILTVSRFSNRSLSFTMMSLFLLTFPLSSHAFVYGMVFTQFFHLLGTAVWVGGLVGLVLYSFFLGESIQKLHYLHDLLTYFSVIALIMFVIISFTGLIMSFSYVGSWEGLTSSSYGDILLWKILLSFIIVIIAAFHRFIWFPKLKKAVRFSDKKKSIKQLIWTVRLELIVITIVVVLAGVLSATSPPSSPQGPDLLPNQHNHR
ncbi:CopD family protein [Alkalihalobacillus sp. MEB130]|uniref:copper resistance D family protein n=1 Tax=Alkalihalobacillus sp. MEB130 TaxID=2976704 RepID=UPI0028E068E9|nr:CopD family protein [Alkalihalobacillus sp. MEB130]MDT8861062.1 CopD family protein [Alkalihalobacillus sp. MEB130]